jgi:hypothetical protein
MTDYFHFQSKWASGYRYRWRAPRDDPEAVALQQPTDVVLRAAGNRDDGDLPKGSAERDRSAK